MSSTSSMGYVGNGRKYTHIETESVRAISGGATDLLLNGGSKSVVIESKDAVADAIQLNASDVAGGLDMSSGTGGTTIDSTGVVALTGGAASKFAVGGVTSTLTISSATNRVILSGGGITADAVDIKVSNSVGGVSIAGGIAGITITSTGTAANSILLDATASNGGITFSAGTTGGGIKVGDSTLSRVGFYGTTPVILPKKATTADAGSFVAGGGTAVTDTSTWGAGAWTLGEIIEALDVLGLIDKNQ